MCCSCSCHSSLSVLAVFLLCFAMCAFNFDAHMRYEYDVQMIKRARQRQRPGQARGRVTVERKGPRKKNAWSGKSSGKTDTEHPMQSEDQENRRIGGDARTSKHPYANVNMLIS